MTFYALPEGWICECSLISSAGRLACSICACLLPCCGTKQLKKATRSCACVCSAYIRLHFAYIVCMFTLVAPTSKKLDFLDSSPTFRLHSPNPPEHALFFVPWPWKEVCLRSTATPIYPMWIWIARPRPSSFRSSENNSTKKSSEKFKQVQTSSTLRRHKCLVPAPFASVLSPHQVCPPRLEGFDRAADWP